MPLLNKKPFFPEEYPLELKENDEVFVCHLTKEIFKDYDDFCERIILCNSLVWSCSLTGRSHLTYQEAAASEDKVRKLLKRFPMELREPVLYLSSICERRSLVELAEEVYSFVKDRYFIGETVEVELDDETESCTIISVIPPKPEELKHFGKDKDERHSPPAVSYKYVIEIVESGKQLTVKADALSRRKSAYSKDKNRLYIKQFVHNNQGIWRLKDSANAKYGINNIKFDQIFCGAPPDMNPKKPVKQKAASFDKAKKQETINKYFKSSPKKNGLPPKKSPKKNTAQPSPSPEPKKVKRKSKKEIEEEKERYKAMKKEKLMRQRAVMLETRAKYNRFVKEWNMVREDLECEDLKEMPTPHPVVCNIPSEYLGDVIVIMEFLRSFNKILNIKDFFPNGITFELLERALTVKEIVGPLSDLLQLLLCRIFGLQEGELDEIKDYDFKGSMNLIMDRVDDEAIKLSKFAAMTEMWVKKHHGLPLAQLQLDTSTITEMLRLHLLISGSLSAGSKTAKWRYQARGGYFSTDDPGLRFRAVHPEIIEKLGNQSVFDLDMGEKLKLIKCLIDQILTYSATRDIIEEGCDKAKQCRTELRLLKLEQARKDKEEAIRLKDLKKSGVAIPETKVEVEDKEKDDDEERGARERELRSGVISTSKMQTLAAEMGEAVRGAQLGPMGTDRAYRRYWFVQSIPALLVEDNDDFRGPCLPRCTPSAAFNSEDSLAYIKMLFKQKHSNKENISGKQENIMNSSPKKLLAEKNGEASPVARNRTKSESSPLQPLTCWADPENCPVHKANTNRPVWSFIKDKNELERLILSLNKRGFRERKLKEALIEEKETISKALEKFPLHLFSGEEDVEPTPEHKTLVARIMKAYDNDNLGFPPETPLDEIIEHSLRESILETEEKIFGGVLGVLKVKSREIWRNAIKEKSYDRQCKQLVWGTRNREEPMEVEVENTEKEEDEESRSSTPSLEYPSNRNSYPKGFDPPPQKQVFLDLASAIIQVAQSIEHKFLKPPLGLNQKEKEKGVQMPTVAMERYEKAVMESTSYSQLFLHLSTLENSVLWNRSALNAYCRICRRKADPENMLLCDTCNKGHHMYCLKPKLTKVPAGDWFCPRCKPVEIRPTRSKKRKMFTDDSEEEESDVEIETTCAACNEAGAQLVCDTCETRLHLVCVNPPVRKAPKSKWFCHDCRAQNATVAAAKKEAPASADNGATTQRANTPSTSGANSKSDAPAQSKKEKPRTSLSKVARDSDDLWDLPNDTFEEGERSSRRKCSKAATAKISQFAKQLRSSQWTENGEMEEEPIPEENRPRRPRRSALEMSKKSRDLPLDNAALLEILDNLMHHRDAWPFLRPVTKSEVPDYHHIIKKPMDFATIKHKLNMLEYKKNSELIADAELLFSNCRLYNQDGSEVFKAGETLEKLFYKLCHEHNLIVNGELTSGPPAKRPRTVL